MNRFIRKIFILCAGAAVLMSGCGAAEKTPVNPSVTSSQQSGDTVSVQNTGLLGSFRTQDLSGAAVDQSVFSNAQLTMVNVWATYCGYCIQEMPALSELSEEYKQDGLQIIGLVTDVTDYDGSVNENQLKTAKEIAKKTGASYTHLLPSAGFQKLLSMSTGVPTTVFVDKDGNQVGKTYPGAKSKAEWQKIIKQTLSEAK